MNSATAAPPSSSSVSTFSTLLGSTLESLIHELLHSRSIYPPDSFALFRHLGVRCHASRVPQVCDYIADFLRVALPCIVNGAGDCITLIILEEETTTSGVGTTVGERTGMTKTVERFVFHFDIDSVVIGKISDSSTEGGEKKMKSSNIVDIEDFMKTDSDVVANARAHMERSMREMLLSIVALRKRRRRPDEKAENMSFKLCLHVVGEHNENGKRMRDRNSCPDELMRALKQGEWFVPEESSCYFPSSAFASAGQNHSKGMLRPVKDISLPSCGMKMQLGMEVDPM